MSESQREEETARNANIKTGITRVPIIVDEAPKVVINEGSNSEGNLTL